MLKPSKMNLNENLFGKEFKNAELPNDTSYNFLYERNKEYMNSVAIVFGNESITYGNFIILLMNMLGLYIKGV